MPYHDDDRLRGSRILKAQRYHLEPIGNEEIRQKDRMQKNFIGRY